MKDFPYKYYFYGSHDSIDEDVIIEIPKSMMPEIQEDRKRLVKSITDEWNLEWNSILVVIEDGVIIDTIYPKSWIDSLNNSLYYTYVNHLDKQVYENPITRPVERNSLLAIYKCARTVIAMCTRTHYRPIVKPISKGCHPFEKKIEALKQIDFMTIEDFNQPNMNNEDVWKVLAFYIGQNLSLIKKNNEIYTKNDLLTNHPFLQRMIYRNTITTSDKRLLNHYLDKWIYMVECFGQYTSNDTILECKDEIIDMKNEIYYEQSSSNE